MISGGSSNHGFSVIELMFSMAIGSLILIAAATLLGTTGDQYARAGGGVAAEREARALLAQLAADFSKAVYHDDMAFGDERRPWPLDHASFLALQSVEAQSDLGRVGDLCVVRYYVKDLTIGGKTVRCLLRGIRESSVTFEALRTGEVTKLIEVESTSDDVIAFGVVSFQVRPMVRDDAGGLFPWKNSKLQGPDSVEVKLVVARRELAAKLRTTDDWDGAGGAGSLLGDFATAGENRNLEIYGTLIRFGNDRFH